MFKDARGINDPCRASKIRTYPVSYDYFCNTFLPHWRFCETEKQIDWVYEKEIADMFDYYIEDDLEIQIYYTDRSNYFSTLCWKLPEYSKEWIDVQYNSSSGFAMMLCDLYSSEDAEEEDPINFE